MSGWCLTAVIPAPRPGPPPARMRCVCGNCRPELWPFHLMPWTACKPALCPIRARGLRRRCLWQVAKAWASSPRFSPPRPMRRRRKRTCPRARPTAACKACSPIRCLKRSPNAPASPIANWGKRCFANTARAIWRGRRRCLKAIWTCRSLAAMRATASCNGMWKSKATRWRSRRGNCTGWPRACRWRFWPHPRTPMMRRWRRFR